MTNQSKFLTILVLSASLTGYAQALPKEDIVTLDCYAALASSVLTTATIDHIKNGGTQPDSLISTSLPEWAKPKFNIIHNAVQKKYPNSDEHNQKFHALTSEYLGEWQRFLVGDNESFKATHSSKMDFCKGELAN